MKRLLSALVLLALAGGVAAAGVPDPNNSLVLPPDGALQPRILGILDERPAGVHNPHPFANLTITIRNFANVPINGVYVVVELNSECDAPLCVCDMADLTGYTNASGQVVINVGLGGCCHVDGGAAAAIYADGVVIRSYDYVVSPDWNEALGNCVMGLDDFTIFGNYWVSGAGGCTDYDGNGATGIVDFSIFGQGWRQGCTQAP